MNAVSIHTVLSKILLIEQLENKLTQEIIQVI